jgi:hypothetical protein
MIDLVPMTAEEYEAYLEEMAPDYAREHVEAGNWPEEGSVERAVNEMREVYLPQTIVTNQCRKQRRRGQHDHHRNNQ